MANTLGTPNTDDLNAATIASVCGIVGTPVLGHLRIALEVPRYT